MAELRAAVGAEAPEGPREVGEFGHGEDPVIWTAERTTRLYAINTALSVALTLTQVADVVVNQALAALAADAGAILLSADGSWLRALNQADADLETSIDTPTVNESSPFAQAARSAQAVWIETPEELKSRFHLWTCAPWSLAGSLAIVPLIAEGRVLGVIAFRFDAPRAFTFGDRAFMLVLAQQCAAAFERVHLYEQVRRAAALEERNRLARDLHDSVSQALYAIALSVAVGRRHLAQDLSRVARSLDSIESQAQAAQADLRALLFDLHADSFSRTDLVDALLERAEFMRRRHGIVVRTELCEEPFLGQQCKEALYGIAREALHNAAKHARASCIDLQLAQSPEGLVLEIKDDGIGFEPGVVERGHYGMQSMRERASELGATLRVESARGQGTRVVTVVPAPGRTDRQDTPPCRDPGVR
jgi:signal transduction histidine kinase